MIDVYTVALQESSGVLQTVVFAGSCRSQVLYAVMELYPDCRVVRVSRDGQWDERADGPAADAGAPW